MAVAYINVVVRVQDRTAADIAARLSPGPQDAAHANRIATRLSRLIDSLPGGTPRGNIWLSVVDDTGVLATGGIVCNQATAAGDTVTFSFGPTALSQVVLTEGVDFLRGASNATLALALANAINAHPVLSGLMVATPVAAAVNLVTTLPGPFPLTYTMATNDVASFALTQFTGGTTGVASLPFTQYSQGPNP